MSESKPLLRAHFWSNYVQTFFGWCKITQILCQMFFFVKKKVKYWVYFFPAALHCEFDIWNIQIFSKNFHKLDEQKYLDSVFKGYGQLVPSISYTSLPQPVWIATDSLAIQLLQKTVFNSYPNIDWKWNCKGENLQIFSSEIILAWENGSQGHHFLQILNFQIP